MSEYTSKNAREYIATLPKKDQKLPKAFKRKWVAALRSGSFARTTGQLCKVEKGSAKTGYCCLGVAGIVLGNSTEELGNHVVLQEKHGKRQAVPKLLIGGDNAVVDYLVNLNDNKARRAGFITIANWVEKNL